MKNGILYEVNYQHNEEGKPIVSRMFLTLPDDYDKNPGPVMNAIRRRIEETVTGRYVIETVKKVVEYTDNLFKRDFGSETRQIAAALK